MLWLCNPCFTNMCLGIINIAVLVTKDLHFWRPNPYLGLLPNGLISLTDPPLAMLHRLYLMSAIKPRTWSPQELGSPAKLGRLSSCCRRSFPRRVLCIAVPQVLPSPRTWRTCRGWAFGVRGRSLKASQISSKLWREGTYTVLWDMSILNTGRLNIESIYSILALDLSVRVILFKSMCVLY